MALFVVGVTWISRSEIETGRSRAGSLGLVLQDARDPAACWPPRSRPAVPRRPAAIAPIVPLVGSLVLLLVAGSSTGPPAGAVRDPVPARLQGAVKTGVLSLIWLNVGVVAAVRGPGRALAVAALWVPAFVLAGGSTRPDGRRGSRRKKATPRPTGFRCRCPHVPVRIARE